MMLHVKTTSDVLYNTVVGVNSETTDPQRAHYAVKHNNLVSMQCWHDSTKFKHSLPMPIQWQLTGSDYGIYVCNLCTATGVLFIYSSKLSLRENAT